MIDPQWLVIDLDPVTWRNIGPFIEPSRYIAAAQPGEHGLFVLHDGGQLLKVVDTKSKSRPEGIPSQISDPHALAQELYGRGAWQRVHIIDRRHLAWVAQQAQATPHRELTMDGYYHLVYTLLWGKAGGYVCEPPMRDHAYGWTYSQVQRFIADLPSPSTLALGVYAEDALSIGLILVCEGGQIRRVTTFEGLDWQVAQPGPTQHTMTALCEALEAQFAPPAAVLLCTDEVFTGWLAATDKLASLAEAHANGNASWSLAASPSQ